MDNRNTLEAKAYRILSRELMAGHHKPGQALSLRPLAASIGTSPTPIRGAVSRLIAERALVLLPNRTVVVPTMTRARFSQLFHVRQLLEGEAAELACANMTPELLRKLTKINSSVKDYLARKQIRRALVHNRDFHLSLYQASRTDVLLPIIEMLWRQAGPFIGLALKLQHVKWSAQFHDHILDGLKTGNRKKVKRSVQSDIRETMHELFRNAVFEDDQPSLDNGRR